MKEPPGSRFQCGAGGSIYTLLLRQQIIALVKARGEHGAQGFHAAMFLTVLIAKSIGCTLPLFASKLHLDPALMASPLITTLVDACSLTILFSIATAVMHV